MISNAILISIAKHIVSAGLFRLVIHRTLVYVFIFVLILQCFMGAFIVPLNGSN